MATEKFQQFDLRLVPGQEEFVTKEELQAVLQQTLANLGSKIIRFGYGNNIFRVGPEGMWLGNADYENANFRSSIDGNMRARAGTIGGFNITNDEISATNLSLVSGPANTARITVGTGDNLAGMNSGSMPSDIAFWAGASFNDRTLAPFQVKLDGSIIARNATISGVLEKPFITAEFTAGEDIIAGRAVCYDYNDHKIYYAYSRNPINCFGFVGIAVDNISSGETGRVALSGSVISRSGTEGATMILDGNVSTIDRTSGNYYYGYTEIYGSNYVAARVLSMSDNLYIVSVWLPLRRIGDPGDVTVYLVPSSSSSNLTPDFSRIIAQKTLPQTFFDPDGNISNAQAVFVFDRMAKATEAKWIVVAAPSGNSSNKYEWPRSISSVDLDGESVSSDSGATWSSIDPNKDHALFIECVSSAHTPGGLEINNDEASGAKNVKVVGRQIDANNLLIEKSPNVYIFNTQLFRGNVSNTKITTGFLLNKISVLGRAQSDAGDTSFSYGLATNKNNQIVFYYMPIDKWFASQSYLLVLNPSTSGNDSSISLSSVLKDGFTINITNSRPLTVSFVVEG